MIPELPWDVLGALGSAAGNVITDGWIVVMTAFWAAALWLLGWVLGFVDLMLQPDLRPDGPGREVYLVTWALGISLAVILSIVQGIVALGRGDGRSLGRLLMGVVQFWLVLTGALTYAVLVVTSSTVLTRLMMEVLLGVSQWRDFEPWTPFSLEDITDAGAATVLGIMSFFVIVAAVAFFLIMVARSAALLVMATTMPIAAAGLVSDVGRTWLWKLSRWFHAAALSPVVVVLVMGLGIKLANGVVVGDSLDVTTSVGTAFGATILIAVSTMAPLALFKLLAFMDPGTASGASARAGWAAVGGLQGLVRGGSDHGSKTSLAASSKTQLGASEGEGNAQSSIGDRFATALNGLQNPITRGGPTTGNAPGGHQQPGQQNQGQNQQGPNQQGPNQQGPNQQGQQSSLWDRARGAAADGLGAYATLGNQGAALTADMDNQSGVGHNGYYPDFSGSSPRQDRGAIANQVQGQHSGPQGNQGQQSGQAQRPTPVAGFGQPPADPANSSNTGGSDPS